MYWGHRRCASGMSWLGRVFILIKNYLRTIAVSEGTRPFLVRFPFSLWHVIGFVSETLPTPLITRNQVELMGKDNIPEPDAPGFEALQISPQAIENILPQMLQAAREKAEA